MNPLANAASIAILLMLLIVAVVAVVAIAFEVWYFREDGDPRW